MNVYTILQGFFKSDYSILDIETMRLHESFVPFLYYELFPIFHYTGFVYSHVVFTDSFFKKKQIF